MVRINLISNPRNLSTALMYSFAQRPDTRVVDEPFYGYYLHSSGAGHPGREEILSMMETDPHKVFDLLDRNQQDKEVLFIKNMANHLARLPFARWMEFKNILYIRNPGLVISSFAKVIGQPTVEDVGFLYQYQMFKYLQDHGHEPVVLDSGILLSNPEKTLKALCIKLNIPFYPEMLKWSPGPRREDGPWAKYWYHNVHQSSGFENPSTGKRPFPEHCRPLLDACTPYYLKLFEVSLKH